MRQDACIFITISKKISSVSKIRAAQYSGIFVFFVSTFRAPNKLFFMLSLSFSSSSSATAMSANSRFVKCYITKYTWRLSANCKQLDYSNIRGPSDVHSLTIRCSLVDRARSTTFIRGAAASTRRPPVDIEWTPCDESLRGGCRVALMSHLYTVPRRTQRDQLNSFNKDWSLAALDGESWRESLCPELGINSYLTKK